MAGQNEEILKVSANPTPNSMPNPTPEHVTPVLTPKQTPKPPLFCKLFSCMVVSNLTCWHDETLTNTSNGGTKRRNFEVSPNPILPKPRPDLTPCIDIQTDSRTNALSTTFFISRGMGIYDST
jgi:hypothetical protein